MTIYALGGVSGTGKTHFRTRTCTALRNARVADIGDVYDRSAAEGQPNLHWRVAMDRFGAIIRTLLEADRTGDIVLEAFFRPGGEQRRMVENLAREYSVNLMYGWAAAPRAECERRVKSVGDADSEERKHARLDFIRSAESRFFNERVGESLQTLANHAEKSAKARNTRKEASAELDGAEEDGGSAKKKARAERWCFQEETPLCHSPGSSGNCTPPSTNLSCETSGV